MYRDLGALPEPLRSQGRAELRTYVTDMIQFEWPSMTQGHFSNAGRDDAERIAYAIERFRPANSGEQDVHESSIQQMQRIFDARRVRLQQVAPSVPSVLWFALGIGAAMVLGFAFMFGVENGDAQLIMTAGLAAVMAVLFVVIFEFDRPFRGDVGLDVSVWRSLAERLTHIT